MLQKLRFTTREYELYGCNYQVYHIRTEQLIMSFNKTKITYMVATIRSII